MCPWPWKQKHPVKSSRSHLVKRSNKSTCLLASFHMVSFLILSYRDLSCHDLLCLRLSQSAEDPHHVQVTDDIILKPNGFPRRGNVLSVPKDHIDAFLGDYGLYFIFCAENIGLRHCTFSEEQVDTFLSLNIAEFEKLAI